EERPRKKKRLARGIGSTNLDEEKERLARQDEVDLQVELALSCEEACRSGLIVVSPKATMRPIHSGLVPSHVPVVDIKDNAMSPAPSSKREPSKTSALA
ncbi:hypothetical protein ACLOJK_026835, partial [Asimina triloba]